MFSEKYGYKPDGKIQFESISQKLRNRIWNLFYNKEIIGNALMSVNILLSDGKPPIQTLVADKLGVVIGAGKTRIDENTVLFKYIMECEWFEVYDFVDIYISCLNGETKKKRVEEFNLLFEEEKAGYRIILDSIRPITDTKEIESLSHAVDTPFESVNIHMQKALDLYSDLQNPDYENSIKESISAVESICNIINGKNTTLNKAIEKLTKKGVHIHSQLKEAFLNIYNYTSDEKGIRHAGIDFVNAPEEDAKYMLIVCSAFINYLLQKMAKIKYGE